MDRQTFENIDFEIKRAVQQLTERFTDQTLRYIIENDLQDSTPEEIANKYFNIKPVRRCRTKIISHDCWNCETKEDIMFYAEKALDIINRITNQLNVRTQQSCDH